MQLLLDSCDRGDPVQARDYAILMLVARLGLRSIEVARLELGDIDWRAGRIIIRGKASREDGMPLPTDVGRALAEYHRLLPRFVAFLDDAGLETVTVAAALAWSRRMPRCY